MGAATVESFGEFAATQTLHTGVETSLLRVTHPKIPGPLVAKVCKPVGLPGPDTPAEKTIKEFVAVSAILQKLSAPNWIKPVAAGRTDDSAWYIVPEAERSLRNVGDPAHPVDDAGLSAIMKAVLDGLLILRKKCRRTHSNLEANNILILGPGPLIECKICLTDPAPARAAAIGSEEEDLAALGRLLRPLLMNAVHCADSATRMPLAAATKWDNICQRLTARDHPDGPLRIEDAMTLLQGGEVFPLERKRSPLVAIATMAVLIAVAVLALPGLWTSHGNSTSSTQTVDDGSHGRIALATTASVVATGPVVTATTGPVVATTGPAIATSGPVVVVPATGPTTVVVTPHIDEAPFIAAAAQIQKLLDAGHALDAPPIGSAAAMADHQRTLRLAPRDLSADTTRAIAAVRERIRQIESAQALHDREPLLSLLDRSTDPAILSVAFLNLGDADVAPTPAQFEREIGVTRKVAEKLDPLLDTMPQARAQRVAATLRRRWDRYLASISNPADALATVVILEKSDQTKAQALEARLRAADLYRASSGYRDLPRSLALYQELATATPNRDGDPRAGLMAGLLRVHGVRLEAPDDATGPAGWFDKASKLGPVAALHKALFLASTGESPESDPALARAARENLAALKTLADQKDPDALYLLGALHYLGAGVERDPAAARDLFQRAVDLGDADAAAALAQSLDPAGPQRADHLKYNRVAASAGYPDAMVELFRTLHSGSIAEKSEGVKWLQSACAGNYGAAYVELAGAFSSGTLPGYFPKDRGLALQNYRKSIELGESARALDPATHLLLDEEATAAQRMAYRDLIDKACTRLSANPAPLVLRAVTALESSGDGGGANAAADLERAVTAAGASGTKSAAPLLLQWLYTKGRGDLRADPVKAAVYAKAYSDREAGELIRTIPQPFAREVIAVRAASMAATTVPTTGPAVVIATTHPATNPVVVTPATNPVVVATTGPVVHPATNPVVVATTGPSIVHPATNHVIIATTGPVVRPATNPVVVTPATKPVVVVATTNPFDVTPATNPVVVTPATKPVVVVATTNPFDVNPTTHPIVTKTTNDDPFSPATRPVVIGPTTGPVVIAMNTHTGRDDPATRPVVVVPATKPINVEPATKPVVITRPRFLTFPANTDPIVFKGDKAPIKFIFLRVGNFIMGSPADDRTRGPDEQQHAVRLTFPFYIMDSEVTRGQWKAVMGELPEDPNNAPEHPITDDHPITNITWEQANDFCRKLSDRERRIIRLPSEAEWEFACRAGSKTAWSFGDFPGPGPGNFRIGDSNWQTPRPPKLYKPNRWMLYDMHGNAAEWCADWYGDFAADPVTDPIGPAEGKYRVVRGGSYVSRPERTRSAARDKLAPDQKSPTVGFRAVMEPE